MGVVTRRDSPYFWLTIPRPGLPPLRESTKILARGLPPQVLRENRALAEQVLAARMGDLARARHGLAVDRPRATFRAWARWYEQHVTPTKRTAARERSAIRTLVAFFGRLPLEAVDVDATREYVTMRRKVVKPATVNREVDVLKAIIGAAVPKYLAANPLAGMRRLRARAPSPRVLTYDDECRLLDVLCQPDRAIVIAALDTLLRLSDLIGLRWGQDYGTHLEIPDPKTEPYRVPVSSRLRAALDALPRSGPYVFAHLQKGRGARPRQNRAIRMFRAACEAAGIPYGRPDGVTWHALRHTGATRAMAVPGTSLRDLMALGGWRDLKSVLRYTRPTEVDRALVDAMSQPRRARAMHAEDGTTENT